MKHITRGAIVLTTVALSAIGAIYGFAVKPVQAQSCDLARMDLDSSGYLSLEDVDLWERAFESRLPAADLDGDGQFVKEEKRSFYPALASKACKELLPPGYQRRGVMPQPGPRSGGGLAGGTASAVMDPAALTAAATAPDQGSATDCRGRARRRRLPLRGLGRDRVSGELRQHPGHRDPAYPGR